jgi:hypothetical protein
MRLGVTTVYVEGDGPENLSEAIRALRKGTRLAVMHAWLLAEPQKTTRSRPRASLFAALKEVQERGGVLWELSPDRTSETDCLAIMENAIEWLSGKARGRKSAANGAKSPGRPRIDWSRWRAVMEREWFSLEHRTNEDAARALMAKGVPVRNAKQVYDVLGKSGRGN